MIRREKTVCRNTTKEEDIKERKRNTPGNRASFMRNKGEKKSENIAKRNEVEEGNNSTQEHNQRRHKGVKDEIHLEISKTYIRNKGEKEK
jgi:hypothetical protein